MSMRTVVVALLALICGVSAAIAVGQLRQREQREAIAMETE